jgi:hypothetical protein
MLVESRGGMELAVSSSLQKNSLLQREFRIVFYKEKMAT